MMQTRPADSGELAQAHELNPAVPLPEQLHDPWRAPVDLVELSSVDRQLLEALRLDRGFPTGAEAVSFAIRESAARFVKPRSPFFVLVARARASSPSELRAHAAALRSVGRCRELCRALERAAKQWEASP